MRFEVRSIVTNYIRAVDALANSEPGTQQEAPTFGGHKLMVASPRLTKEKAERIRADLMSHMLVQSEVIPVETGGCIAILTWRTLDVEGTFPILFEEDHGGIIQADTKAVAYDCQFAGELCKQAEREFKQQVKMVIDRL